MTKHREDGQHLHAESAEEDEGGHGNRVVRGHADVAGAHVHSGDAVGIALRALRHYTVLRFSNQNKTPWVPHHEEVPSRPE